MSTCNICNSGVTFACIASHKNACGYKHYFAQCQAKDAKIEQLEQQLQRSEDMRREMQQRFDRQCQEMQQQFNQERQTMHQQFSQQLELMKQLQPHITNTNCNNTVNNTINIENSDLQGLDKIMPLFRRLIDTIPSMNLDQLTNQVHVDPEISEENKKEFLNCIKFLDTPNDQIKQHFEPHIAEMFIERKKQFQMEVPKILEIKN